MLGSTLHSWVRHGFLLKVPVTVRRRALCGPRTRLGGTSWRGNSPEQPFTMVEGSGWVSIQLPTPRGDNLEACSLRSRRVPSGNEPQMPRGAICSLGHLVLVSLHSLTPFLIPLPLFFRITSKARDLHSHLCHGVCSRGGPT